MESLSYTLVSLLQGDLPWAPCCKYMGLTHLYASKKDWSGTQLVDCPSVFGEFVDYTRSLGYTDCPDYAYWKRLFRELCADLPAQPFYDPADIGETFPRDIVNARSCAIGSGANSTLEEENQPRNRLADVAGLKLPKMSEDKDETRKNKMDLDGLRWSGNVCADEDEPHSRLVDTAGAELPYLP